MFADGGLVYSEAFRRGIEPDPEMWIDEWADEFMRIPRGNGAEHGKYRTDRTPPAREVMRCLSPAHPAKRVVAMVASQLLKTQVGINWISASIHQAPANILALLPSLNLAKRVSSRISKTIDGVPVLRDRVASPRSRDSRNTIDTKEFDGGTLYITTAGSAANLSELAARYVYGDEVDRWDVSVDKEGDPIELAEARLSTFGRNAKAYYTSSPTIKGASRIAALFAISDQRYYYVPCVHCSFPQILIFERLIYSEDQKTAHYVCTECASLIEEAAKTEMLAAGNWRAHAQGDGETVGFTLSALYAPLGWTSWAGLGKQHSKAKQALEKGDPEPMQVFYNTRLALCWDNAQERTKASDLRERSEEYLLRSVPDNVLVLTAAMDVQGDRLELQIQGWGEGLENWVLDYQVIHSDPTDIQTWKLADDILRTPLRRANGRDMFIQAVAVDSGGHHTQEVYDFTRVRKYRKVFAVKGASQPGKPVIPSQPSKKDVNIRGVYEKRGVDLWNVGTDTAKDWIFNRLKLSSGPGAMHFSRDLPEEYFDQITSEFRMVKYVKGRKRVEYHKGKGVRNEALDLSVYNLSAAHRLGLHKWHQSDWERARLSVDAPQSDMFLVPAAQSDGLKGGDPVSAAPPAAVEVHVQNPAPAGFVVSAGQNWQPRGAGFKPRTR